ncbi:glycosyltransferase family 4 protein [Halomonas sp. McH1-25]|uniref:glycosyltransferase family 4 protein n=1 Tax=unclassified Halomonas TaxID=2609666 RepID=UPI001EF6B7B1|nr:MULTISPECIES: glycosyltransferase family 4 protein [unclassified Halomonas]MCG7598281.1 glycosyltransferase family 4 protein [Halomonas sp. McH1-25]MCP1340936.1 glycosyltransferase family 4 protein [Halomonas sp. FL8]MCP1362507.1 glycosyltransferase family 4 protein [Halomonas sp. BBD45]
MATIADGNSKPLNPRIGHLVSLKNLGGIERYFTRYFSRFAAEYDQHILKQTDGIHPLLEPYYKQHAAGRIHSIKGPGFVKIPRAFHNIRSRYQRSLLERLGIEAILVWGKIVNHPLRFPDNTPVVHFERGSAWLVDDQPALHTYLKRLDGALCNSHAALRMLQLKWGLSSELPSRVLYNTIELPSNHALHPEGRFRLGFAGRLVPLKAPMVALEAFAGLKTQYPQAEFWIAGEGPLEGTLRKQAKQWGLEGSVRFCGLVDDMASFYSSLDAFICPSWREPFGNVAQEALAYGVPTLVGAVDGLAEQVQDGVNGAVLSPRRNRHELGKYGQACLQGPDEVYSPERDAIVQAGIIEPEETARVLGEWAGNPARRREMGARARARIRDEFNIDQYGQQLVGFMSEVIARGR